MNPSVKVGQVQTDLGLIPMDWNITRIDAHCSIKTGSRNTQDKVEGGAYPFYVRSQQVERINSYSYDGEAVLTAGDGVGTGKVFHYINGKFDVHQRVYRISDFSDHLHGRYFFYQFSTRFYERIMSMTAKSSVDSVRMEMIAGMQIPLPPVHEQVAIASALDDIDALLSSLDQLIAKKRDIQQATRQQLLTGQRRLPGFSGEWAVKRLGDHLSFLRNGTNSRAELSTEGDVHYLHYGDIHGSQHLLLNPAKTSMPCLPRDKAKRLDRLNNGDLVFADASEDLDGVGKSAEVQLPEDMELVAGLHTIAVRFDKKVMTDGFKAYLQFIPKFRSHLRQLAAGTKVYATNRAHIASAELKIPGIEEQAAVATILSDMDAELAALETRRDKACQLKQGMMQELLTGRIRLTNQGV